MFTKKGVITIERGGLAEDKVFEAALEAGADDISEGDGVFEIATPPDALEDVKSTLETAGMTVPSAELAMVPQTTITLRGREAEQTLKLLEALEDHDDVQTVSANVDIPEDEIEQLSA
jgi:transcriptional/translational regulatory protein YebC/TACO1